MPLEVVAVDIFHEETAAEVAVDVLLHHDFHANLYTLLAGRKRFKGALEGYHEGEVRLFIENPEGATKEPVLIGVPFADISDAKLVLTDALIEAAKARLPKGYGDGAEIDEDQISQERSEDDNG